MTKALAAPPKADRIVFVSWRSHDPLDCVLRG
jgi:hypothetical protein